MSVLDVNSYFVIAFRAYKKENYLYKIGSAISRSRSKNINYFSDFLQFMNSMLKYCILIK